MLARIGKERYDLVHNKEMQEGKIFNCSQLSEVCDYGCCHQCNKQTDNSAENSLILFPGELDHLAKNHTEHIDIKEENFHGGKLGYCKKECFDQSNCTSELNYKPLDCQSYPFFPSLIKGKLELMIDDRCPLSNDKESLKEHYTYVYKMWTDLIKKNNGIYEWLSAFKLEGYKEYPFK